MQADVSHNNDNQNINSTKIEPFMINSKPLQIEQRPRSTGFKSFLNWFKKVENLQRNVEEDVSSISDSSEDDSSASSTATVASFAFLPANNYKPYGDACQPEKFIASGPYTDTYHRLIVERNRRRNLDKNLSLRKKYSLYSSGTLGARLDSTLKCNQKVVHAENVNCVQVYDTFSLPAIVKKNNYDVIFNDDRKTASLSSKDKAVVNCHVKGKRKAPQPPVSADFTKTYRKKRQAPPPPKQTFYTSHITEERTVLAEPQISPGIQGKHKIPHLDMDKTKNALPAQSELSPKPWYKRQVIESKAKNKNSKNDSSKKKSKLEYPEVGFFRCSRIFENKKQSTNSDKSEADLKNEKRSSCYLPNISELDREAAEIIKLHKKDLQSRCVDAKENQVNQINKPSSARDLINKFNALTSALEADRVCNGKDEARRSVDNSPLLLTRKHEFCKNISNDLGEKGINLNNSKSVVKKESDAKTSTFIPEPSQSFEAEVFSAIANFDFSENKISSSANNNLVKIDDENEITKNAKMAEADEKHRLRELLKEMKNSLPKRPKPVKYKENEVNITHSKSNDNVLPSCSKNDNVGKNTNSTANVLENSQSKPLNRTPENSSVTSILLSNISRNNEKNEVNTRKAIISETNNKYAEEKINGERLPLRESNKVSSSAQTNCVLKKSDVPSNNKPSNILPHATAAFSASTQQAFQKPKEDERLTLDNASSALYINVHESRLAFPKPQLKDPQTNSGNTKVLLKQLETAIAQGDDLLAAKLAKDLALLKVNCSVTSTTTMHAKEVNIKNIQIYIEDQFSHQGPISLRIKENITLADLKARVFEELRIPEGVQRWIIGKQLTTNDDSLLTTYNDNDFEIPLFLYIVAPEVSTEKEVQNAQKVPENVAKVVPVQNEISNRKIEKSTTNNNNISGIPKPIVEDSPTNANMKTPAQGPSKVKITTESPAMKDVIKKTWICSACTLINSLLSPLCSACGARKLPGPEKTDAAPNKTETKPPEKDHYKELVNLDNSVLVLNTEQFECPVCLMDCKPGAGVTLRECLHSFCKECLVNTVKFSEEAEIKCPYRDKDYFCDITIQEREIKALVNKTLYEQHLAKSVNLAENKTRNAFHCKSPDCKGWCIFEENVNDFHCPVCKKINCLTCQAIHEGRNCKEHQELEQGGEAEGRRTRQMLQEMVARGEALACPSCQVVLMKKWGCDWVRCSMCKTEICWVTRGPRWGPAGKGDTSAGCQCGLNGVKCHPKCNYCH